MDGVLRSSCTSTEQEYILLHQPNVGVDDEKETTATSQQPLFARSSRVLRRSDSSNGRQLGLPSRTSSLTGLVIVNHYFSENREMFLAYMLSVCSFCFPCVLSVFCLCMLPVSPHIAEAGTKGDRNDRDVSDA